MPSNQTPRTSDTVRHRLQARAARIRRIRRRIAAATLSTVVLDRLVVQRLLVGPVELLVEPEQQPVRGHHQPVLSIPMLATALGGHFFWMTSRAAGTAALLTSSVSVGLGLLMGGRLLKRRV